MMLLKVDLAKAFDTVAWPYLLEVLEHIGFPPRWRDWIAAMLGMASTRVLINGRPSRRICHARGLRQGDPLSPFLFIVVMEVLNALISAADRQAVLTPLPGDAIRYRASIYTDDLVIFLAPSARDFHCIRQILDLFAEPWAWPQVYHHADPLLEQHGRSRATSFPLQTLGIPHQIPRGTIVARQVEPCQRTGLSSDLEGWTADHCWTRHAHAYDAFGDPGSCVHLL